MPALSARQIITPALQLIGVAAAEAPISAFMAENAREALNSMLDSWSLDHLLMYTRPKIQLVLVPDRSAYTWGVSTPPADIPFEPPVKLEMAVLTVDVQPPGLEWAVTILDQTEYESGIAIKQHTSPYPTAVYLAASVPVAVLHVWPVPDQPYTLQLLPWSAQRPYGAYDEVLEWPAGWQRPLTYGLALELAPMYGVEPSPLILRTAEESRRAIYVPNTEVGRLSLTMYPRPAVGAGGLSYPAGFREGWR